MKKAVAWLAILIGAFACGQSVARAAYPDKPIHIIVPYTPGGTVDLLARAMAPRLNKRWGQQIVVENRPGAGGSVGAEYVAAQPGDGYTLLLSTNSPLTTNLALFKSVKYDPLRDFVPVILAGQNSLALVVNAKLPIKSVSDLIELAKKQPGQLIGASSGNGTTSHLSLTEFNKMAGVKITHVPYPGGVPSLTAVISGEAQTVFSDIVPALPMIKDGRVRALATTGLARSGVTPDLPTLNESGLKGFDVIAWIGMVGPKGMSADVVDKLNTEINAVLKDPGFRQQIIRIGIDPTGDTPQAFGQYLAEQIPVWRRRAIDAGLKVE